MVHTFLKSSENSSEDRKSIIQTNNDTSLERIGKEIRFEETLSKIPNQLYKHIKKLFSHKFCFHKIIFMIQ